jgi:hypothetical protein
MLPRGLARSRCLPTLRLIVRHIEQKESRLGFLDGEGDGGGGEGS